MNIAIVGAGITGISTALEFARDGHQVTVYEQMNATAEDASFAPSGLLAPLAAQSLAAPGLGMPLKQLESGADLLRASAMIGSPTWRWMRQWKNHEKCAIKLGSSTSSSALHALGHYSASLRLQREKEIEFTAEHKNGGLVLLRTPQEVEFWNQHLPSLQDQGVSCRLLNPQQAQVLEPGLGNEIAWLNALYFPQAQSLNPRLWAHCLRTHAHSLGVMFHTGTEVKAIHASNRTIHTHSNAQSFDAIVICTGATSDLLQRVGIKLPMISIWGYSVTAPVRDTGQAPRAAIVDWAQQTTITRMGQRVRIAAGMEVGSTATAPHHTPTLQRMYRLLNDWFPGGVQLSGTQVQVWRGARSYLPDGLPATGSTQHPGIWLNLAHGSHGVSLATGCARAIADMATGKTPAIDMQAFSPLRF